MVSKVIAKRSWSVIILQLQQIIYQNVLQN